jgi:hypothetical protein
MRLRLAAFEKDVGDDARRSGRQRHLLACARRADRGYTLVYAIDLNDRKRNSRGAIAVLAGALCLSLGMAKANRNKKEHQGKPRSTESYPPSGRPEMTHE